MKADIFEFPASDGAPLHGQVWAPADPAARRGVVCLVHGFGEHCDRYGHVGERLVESGYVLLGYDQRGHGRSGGQRGYTPSIDQLLDDVGTAIREAQTRFPDLPTFLYGHSMGGGEVLHFALRRRPSLAGVISTSPWLRLTKAPPAHLVVAAKVLQHVLPRFAIQNEFERGVLSSDPAVEDDYYSDPLVHGSVTPVLAEQMRAQGEWCLDHAAQTVLPTLLMHGTADPVTSCAATEDYARAAGRRATFVPWPGMLHETHNEIGKGQVLDRLVQFLDAHAADDRAA